MKIDSKMTDAVVLSQWGSGWLGFGCRGTLTQQQLAEQAGLGLRTVQRLELGMQRRPCCQAGCGVLRVPPVGGSTGGAAARTPQRSMVQVKQQGTPPPAGATSEELRTGPAKPWT